MLCRITDGSISLGGQMILSHFDFQIKDRERVALVGENGTGKSTLCRILAGEQELDSDDRREGEGLTFSRAIRVGMLRQSGGSLLERLAPGSGEVAGKTSGSGDNGKEAIAGDGAKPEMADSPVSWKKELEELAVTYQTAFPDKERHDFDKELSFWLSFFDLTLPEERADGGASGFSSFSGGEQTKLALAGLFLMRPELLILDEPTNHLDQETTEKLEKLLPSYEGAVLVVSHDRYFLDQVAQTVYECRGKKLTRYAGNYTSYVREREKRYEQQKKAWDRQQEEIERKEALIRRFKTKPTKASMTRAKRKELERMARVPKPEEAHAPVRFAQMVPERPGSKWVWQVTDGVIGYQADGKADKVLIRDVNMRIKRGDKIGIIGRNGAGKSTLLRTIQGDLPLLGGKALLGQNVETGCLNQQMKGNSGFPGSVREHFQKRFPSLTDQQVRGSLARYLFRGRDAEKKVESLSGGERTRLFLAELLQDCPNFLLLDEPDNHMDLSSRENLEAALKAYGGTLLFVTHDRYFLREVADSLLVLENGRLSWYPFGYEHYIRHRDDLQAESITERVQRENASLLAGMKEVPGKERHEIPVSEEERSREWEIAGLEEDMREAALRWEEAAERQQREEQEEWRQWAEETAETWIPREEEREEKEREAVRRVEDTEASGAADDQEMEKKMGMEIEIKIKMEMEKRLNEWTEACCRIFDLSRQS